MKSLGVMNWLKASTDAALTLQPASAQVRPHHVLPARCLIAMEWVWALVAIVPAGA